MSVAPSGPLKTADRLRKLRAMSSGELWTRVRYDAYCRFERTRHAHGGLSRADRLRRALVPALGRRSDWQTALLETRRTAGPSFFAGVERLDETRSLLLERFPEECRRIRVEACRASRHEFEFFGGTFRYPERVDWHADPVTRAQWPRVYHRDVPVHGGDVGFGDVKHVWELGRHQFLIDLAKAWALDRSAAHATAMRTLVHDWRADNPVGVGVGWSCALEPAFRVLSWLWAYFLTLDDPHFDDNNHVDWLEGFHDHGWFLYRHLEYYSSPFNHLIGEACALYCLGVLFPEFREARKWRRHARHVLESRLPAQFYGDGGSVEQSTFYHHATTGFYLLAILVARANGEDFSSRVVSAVERAIEFSMLMQQPDGTTPRIGGADDGKPIRLEHLPFWDFRPYQAIGAVLFGRGDFKATAARFYEDALWLLGPEGAARFDALHAQFPAPASRTLPSSGYVIIRNRWAADADYVCFDCGEQAAGVRRDDVPSAAHGHADCLSVIVWRSGRPVLVDAGFHCYNGPKEWQDHFRETAAHNTIRIDGCDQAVHINKMAWSHAYAATLEAHDVEAANPWIVGSHDGYLRLERGGVLHRRAVWVRERGYVVLCDFLEGTGRHDVELTFQLAPGALHIDGHASFDDIVDIHWFTRAGLNARAYEGVGGPAGGWIAPSLGMKIAAPRLVLSGAIDVPATIVSIIVDRLPARLEVSTTDGGPIRVAGVDWEDWLVVKGCADGSRKGLATDALAAAWRYERGRFTADGRVGGSFQGS